MILGKAKNNILSTMYSKSYLKTKNIKTFMKYFTILFSYYG